MRTHNIFDHIFRFVKANNFARTKHKITFRVFDEYIWPLPQTFKKINISKIFQTNTHSKNTAHSTQFEIL